MLKDIVKLKKMFILIILIAIILFIILMSLYIKTKKNSDRGIKIEEIKDNSMKEAEEKEVIINYQLDFPESWKGLYHLKVDKQGTTKVIYASEVIGEVLLFIILNQSEMEYQNESKTLDSIRKVGEIDNTNYYYATGTGCDLCELDAIINDNSDTHTDDVKAKALKELIDMQKMKGQIEDVLKTFKKLNR